MATAQPFLCSNLSAPPVSKWAAISDCNKRKGQWCSRGQRQLLCCVIKCRGSTSGAALRKPSFLWQLFHRGSAGSSFATRKFCSPLKGKVAITLGRTVNIPPNDNGQASQLEARVPALKERASSGGSTWLSSEDYSSGFNPGPDLIEGNDAGGIKQCTECRHTKPLVDFEGTTTSADGRYDVCRACTAASRAKRAGKKLYHLDLSVAESWERAKTCIGCGRVKEARDFGVNRSKKDCLSKYCRGCVSAHQAAKQDREPTDEPQKCWQCGLVKPATEFHANKKSPTGRRRECSQCVNEVTRRLNAQRRESKDGAFVRSKKRCTACGEEKTAEHYHRRKGPADGLSYMCKLCTTTYFARWKEQRRAAVQALAGVEVPNSSDVPEEKEEEKEVMQSDDGKVRKKSGRGEKPGGRADGAMGSKAQGRGAPRGAGQTEGSEKQIE